MHLYYLFVISYARHTLKLHYDNCSATAGVVQTEDVGQVNEVVSGDKTSLLLPDFLRKDVFLSCALIFLIAFTIY